MSQGLVYRNFDLITYSNTTSENEIFRFDF